MSLLGLRPMLLLQTLIVLGMCPSVFAAVISTGECVAYTATNTQGAVQNVVDCEISVMPGDILHISTCNTSTLSGDTYLRLFDATDTVELTEGDDGCGSDSGGTALTFEVPIAYPNTGVTLRLHQGCFSTHSCGAVATYTLNVEASPVPHPTAAPADDDRYFDIRLFPLAECLDDNYPEKGWNRCDMCICQDFDKIFKSDYDHDCHADEEYYMCMVKYDVKSVTCTTQMKPGWIAGFFFIGFCGFLLFAGALGYILYLLCYARPSKPIQPTLTPLPPPRSVSVLPLHDMQQVQQEPIDEQEEQDYQDKDLNDPAEAKERQLHLQDSSTS